MIVEPKTEGTFVRLPPRIALHSHPHIDIRETEAPSVSIQVILSPSPQNSRPAPPQESETQPRNLRDLRLTDLDYFYSLKTHQHTCLSASVLTSMSTPAPQPISSAQSAAARTSSRKANVEIASKDCRYILAPSACIASPERPARTRCIRSS
jgi:hypothetical protein